MKIATADGAVVPGAEARLAVGMGIHPLDHGGVEPGARGEHEVAVVHATEVHAARLELVGHAQQVLGGVDHVVRDPERARPDVGGAAGQGGERRAGAHEAVGGLVHGAVAAEGHDHVVALARGLAADLGGVAALLRVDRLDRVARSERVDHQVAQPVRHRRGVRVDDDEHASLGRAVGEQALGETLRALEGSVGGHEVINTSSRPGLLWE